MNNSPESLQNPEQRYRAELADKIVKESVGSLSIYTSMDMEPSEVRDWQMRQQERGATDIRNIRGGWGEYGDVEMTKSPLKVLEPDARSYREGPNERLKFVESDDGSVDIRYGFSHIGYKDATGRPGNALNVGFRLSQSNAAELQRAIEADPSFINEVLKAQVLSAGIQESYWDSKLVPEYYEGFRQTVADKDRVIAVSGYSSKGELMVQDELVYGENKSLTVELPRSSIEATQPEKTDAIENEFASTPEQTDAINAARLDDVDAMIERGMSPEQIAAEINQEQARLKTYFDTLADDAPTSFEEERAWDRHDANMEALEYLDQRTKEASKRGNVQASRAEVEQAFDTPAETVESTGVQIGSVVTYGGNTLSVIDSYSAAGGVQWVELSNGQQVMASKLDLRK